MANRLSKNLAEGTEVSESLSVSAWIGGMVPVLGDWKWRR